MHTDNPTTDLAKVAPSTPKRKAKSMEAHFAQMTDEEVVHRYQVLVGTIWAYNETYGFEGRERELGRLRREAHALRNGDVRRAKLIQNAIHAAIADYRGTPIVWDEYEC